MTSWPNQFSFRSIHANYWEEGLHFLFFLEKSCLLSPRKRFWNTGIMSLQPLNYSNFSVTTLAFTNSITLRLPTSERSILFLISFYFPALIQAKALMSLYLTTRTMAYLTYHLLKVRLPIWRYWRLQKKYIQRTSSA